jgi:L-threonylcarbamoyladenylate synthase
VSAAPAPRDGTRAAVDRLRAGGLVAYPTETVYGLGADARSERAVGELRRWKGRAAAQPLAVLVTGLGALEALGVRLSARAGRLAGAFWPGPVTLVLPAPALFAPGVARADGAMGFRCSPHPTAARLARTVEDEGLGPVTATSLNPSGATPARTLAEARRLCPDGAGDPWLLEGEEAWGRTPSSVVDLGAEPPRVLREGAIPAAELEAAW